MDPDRFDSSELDQRSYHLGMIYAFAECVGSGVKRLGLSPPLTENEYEEVIQEVKQISRDLNVIYHVDRDFLESLLFNPDYTRGKIVIHLADSQKTIEEYLALKKKKQEKADEGTLTREIEEDIAWSLGCLLSYSDEAIKHLIFEPRF